MEKFNPVIFLDLQNGKEVFSGGASTSDSLFYGIEKRT